MEEPEVARWWAPLSPDESVDELFVEGAVNYAIEVEGIVVGAILYTEENDPGYRHAALDISLDTAHHGQGLGSDAIRTLARHLFEERGHHRLTIDPAAHNERAIRAYRRVGFRPVGIMREYELGADGTWHDGLLLDLLAGELTAEPK
jgi:aminoglycoside 6'-N-acetyltransferase